jgi:glutathione S-transferase
MSYVLYSAKVCPYAQRSRALLVQLDLPHELREIDLDDRDPEFLALTPTGKVPLLVDGDFSLYESAMINEYLADQHRWGRAFDANPRVRAAQRLAMKQWDAVIAPAWYSSLRDARVLDERAEALSAELDRLELVVDAAGADPLCLLGLHVAPFWARMSWTKKLSPLVKTIERREDLMRWLDATIREPCVTETLPPKAPTVRRYEERFGAAAQ